MLELKVKRGEDGGVVIVDPDGDEHVASTPKQAWLILRALTEPTPTKALVRQDKTPANKPRMMTRRRSGSGSRDEPEVQVIRDPEPEPNGDIVTEGLARAASAVINGIQSLGRSGNPLSHGRRRF